MSSETKMTTAKIEAEKGTRKKRRKTTFNRARPTNSHEEFSFQTENK